MAVLGLVFAVAVAVLGLAVVVTETSVDAAVAATSFLNIHMFNISLSCHLFSQFEIKLVNQ